MSDGFVYCIKTGHSDVPGLFLSLWRCGGMTLALLDFWPLHLAHVAAQVPDAVVQSLDDILAVVGEGARGLHRGLVVISRLEQARREGVVAECGALVVPVGLTVAVRVHEEVREARRVG